MMRRVSVLFLLLMSACLWRSYEQILAIHLDVLTQTANKLGDVAASSQGPALGMAEYAYPAKRARQFLQQFSKHNGRSSYAGLKAFLDRYERMLAEVDAARLGEQIDGTRLRTEITALNEAATTIRAQAAAAD